MTSQRIVVAGAGGFIGSHMVRFLKSKGYWVRGVDIKYPEFSPRDEADEFMLLDLRDEKNCLKATEGSIDRIYQFAANMGGIGFITSVKADVMRDNVLINVNMAEAARRNDVGRILYTSSACIYPTEKQVTPQVVPLKESDAYPADPDNEYGWEKIFSERVYAAYNVDYGLDVRVSRYHNIFGEKGTYYGGREKAPAAICRKVAIAALRGDKKITVWGDGEQTRSFCHVADCVEATYRLMESNHKEPLNIGSDEMVSINQLVDIVSSIEGIKLTKIHQKNQPQGVRGRNADLTLMKSVLGWKNQLTLEDGLRRTYPWIKSQVKSDGVTSFKD